MSPLLLRERSELESDVARSWWSLPLGTLLPLEDGRCCLLVHSGQPGGATGPDVRDAVLRVFSKDSTAEPQQLIGDVEFHLYASAWFAHGHQRDPRYNRVVLHVVHYPDHATPTRRQDGQTILTCSLLDRPRPPLELISWPCQREPLTPSTLTLTLITAGLQRFQEKSSALGLALDHAQADTHWSRYDLCLLPTLAEGLGYGRDRAFFRAAGLRLMGLASSLPEPLGHTHEPAPLDARRLRILRALITRWHASGAWSELRGILLRDEDVKTTLSALRAAFQPLSQARTDILATNIVLPFAAAVAARENAGALASRAQHLYLAYPGLVSNRVTRSMSAQLQLEAEPRQACLQQGLHHIFTRTCQTKNCSQCPCGGQRL